MFREYFESNEKHTAYASANERNVTELLSNQNKIIRKKWRKCSSILHHFLELDEWKERRNKLENHENNTVHTRIELQKKKKNVWIEISVCEIVKVCVHVCLYMNEWSCMKYVEIIWKWTNLTLNDIMNECKWNWICTKDSIDKPKDRVFLLCVCTARPTNTHTQYSVQYTRKTMKRGNSIWSRKKRHNNRGECYE